MKKICFILILFNLLLPISVTANPLAKNSLWNILQVGFSFDFPKEDLENIFQGLVDNAEEILGNDEEEESTDVPMIRRDYVPKLFAGVIEAKITSKRSIESLFAAKIIYTIKQNKIKREVKGKGLRFNELAGVIIDLELDTATLYTKNILGKHYSKVSLKEYEDYVREKNEVEYVPTKYGFGTIFLKFSKVLPFTGENKEDKVTLRNRLCDQLTLVQEDLKFVVDHCRDIIVKPRLVELVELNLPDEVEGFPCRIVYQESVGQIPVPTDLNPNLQKALQFVGKVLEAFQEVKVEVKKVKGGIVDDIEFTVPEGYKQVKSLEKLETYFPISTGGSWDD